MLIKSKEATPFWNKGIFCIRLNYVPKRVYKQDVVVGVDPGSKRNARQDDCIELCYSSWRMVKAPSS